MCIWVDNTSVIISHTSFFGVNNLPRPQSPARNIKRKAGRGRYQFRAFLFRTRYQFSLAYRSLSQKRLWRRQVNNRNILSACYTRKITEKNFSEAIIKLINDFYSDLHVERMTVQKLVKFTIDRMKTILVCVATQLLLCIPYIPVHAG